MFHAPVLQRGHAELLFENGCKFALVDVSEEAYSYNEDTFALSVARSLDFPYIS